MNFGVLTDCFRGEEPIVIACNGVFHTVCVLSGLYPKVTDVRVFRVRCCVLSNCEHSTVNRVKRNEAVGKVLLRWHFYLLLSLTLPIISLTGGFIRYQTNEQNVTHVVEHSRTMRFYETDFLPSLENRILNRAVLVRSY